MQVIIVSFFWQNFLEEARCVSPRLGFTAVKIINSSSISSNSTGIKDCANSQQDANTVREHSTSKLGDDESPEVEHQNGKMKPLDFLCHSMPQSSHFLVPFHIGCCWSCCILWHPSNTEEIRGTVLGHVGSTFVTPKNARRHTFSYHKHIYIYIKTDWWFGTCYIFPYWE